MSHDRGFYKTARWYRLRKEALHLARYRCAHCKRDVRNGGKSVNVHHIIPIEVAPHLAFDLRNLRVLCTKCHNTAHGRGVASGHGVSIDGSPLDPRHPWNAAR